MIRKRPLSFLEYFEHRTNPTIPPVRYTSNVIQFVNAKIRSTALIILFQFVFLIHSKNYYFFNLFDPDSFFLIPEPCSSGIGLIRPKYNSQLVDDKH